MVLSRWIRSCPSVEALRVALYATAPVPPGLLSMTTGWPQRRASCSPSRRSDTSGPLPVDAAVVIFTGLVGQASAAQAPPGNTPASPAAPRASSWRRVAKVGSGSPWWEASQALREEFMDGLLRKRWLESSECAHLTGSRRR